MFLVGLTMIEFHSISSSLWHKLSTSCLHEPCDWFCIAHVRWQHRNKLLDYNWSSSTSTYTRYSTDSDIMQSILYSVLYTTILFLPHLFPLYSYGALIMLRTRSLCCALSRDWNAEFCKLQYLPSSSSLSFRFFSSSLSFSL